MYNARCTSSQDMTPTTSCLLTPRMLYLLNCHSAAAFALQDDPEVLSQVQLAAKFARWEIPMEEFNRYQQSFPVS